MHYITCFLIFILTFFALEGKTVYIINNSRYPHESFFYNENYLRDEITKPFCVLRKKLEKWGYRVKFSYDGKDLEEDFFALISINEINDTILQNISAYPKERCFLLAFDPPLVLPKIYDEGYTEPFGRIYVMFDDLIDNQKYYKFCYPQPRLDMIHPRRNFHQRKLCALIAVNNNYKITENALYPERKDIITFFETLPPGEFGLYGLGWEGHRDWKGHIRHKWPVLDHYKFCICYENTKNQVGYITEKIFDSFIAGCVPVYKGAPNIEEYIPKNCFIDGNQFASVEALYHHLKSIDEKIYYRYIANIRNYLSSQQAQQFSIHHFVHTIKQALKELDLFLGVIDHNSMHD